MRFFEEWSDEWHKFDSFIVRCIQKYLSEGLISAKKSNYEVNKLIAANEDFYDWAENLPLDTKLGRKKLLDNFKRVNPKVKKTEFHKLLREFCDLKDYEYNPRTKGKDDKDRNNTQWVTFGVKVAANNNSYDMKDLNNGVKNKTMV